MVLAQDFLSACNQTVGGAGKVGGWRSWGLGGYLSPSSGRLNMSPRDLPYRLIWASSEGRYLERAVASC